MAGSCGERTHLALLDSAPMGPRQYAIWLLASGGTLLDGFSIFSLGVAMPLLTARFTLSPLMVGLIGSALVLGAAFGAAFGGPAADRFGRKPLLLARHGDPRRRGAHQRRWRTRRTGSCWSASSWSASASASIFRSARPTCPRRCRRSARSRMMVATIALQSVGMLLGAARGACDAAVLARAAVRLAVDPRRDRGRRVRCFWSRGSGFRKARAG